MHREPNFQDEPVVATVLYLTCTRTYYYYYFIRNQHLPDFDQVGLMFPHLMDLIPVSLGICSPYLSPLLKYYTPLQLLNTPQCSQPNSKSMCCLVQDTCSTVFISFLPTALTLNKTVNVFESKNHAKKAKKVSRVSNSSDLEKAEC